MQGTGQWEVALTEESCVRAPAGIPEVMFPRAPQMGGNAKGLREGGSVPGATQRGHAGLPSA